MASSIPSIDFIVAAADETTMPHTLLYIMQGIEQDINPQRLRRDLDTVGRVFRYYIPRYPHLQQRWSELEPRWRQLVAQTRPTLTPQGSHTAFQQHQAAPSSTSVPPTQPLNWGQASQTPHFANLGYTASQQQQAAPSSASVPPTQPLNWGQASQTPHFANLGYTASQQPQTPHSANLGSATMPMHQSGGPLPQAPGTLSPKALGFERLQASSAQALSIPSSVQPAPPTAKASLLLQKTSSQVAAGDSAPASTPAAQDASSSLSPAVRAPREAAPSNVAEALTYSQQERDAAVEQAYNEGIQDGYARAWLESMLFSITDAVGVGALPKEYVDQFPELWLREIGPAVNNPYRRARQIGYDAEMTQLRRQHGLPDDRVAKTEIQPQYLKAPLDVQLNTRHAFWFTCIEFGRDAARRVFAGQYPGLARLE